MKRCTKGNWTGKLIFLTTLWGTNDLLQFRSGGLVLGFRPDRVYMAGMGYLLTEEFVGTNGVRPVSEDSGESNKTSSNNLTKGAQSC